MAKRFWFIACLLYLTLISFALIFVDGCCRPGVEAHSGGVCSSSSSIVSVLLITSIMRIFWKEVAEANNERDLSRLATLYQSVNAGFFLLLLLYPTFCRFKTIITVTVGEAYAGVTGLLLLCWSTDSSNARPNSFNVLLRS